MRLRVLLLLSILASLSLYVIALWWVPLNQDEGWYLMAARRVNQGDMPYRDFAFTQAPLFPYLFQFFQPLIRGYGLLGARIANIGFSLLSALLLLKSLTYFVPKDSRGFARLLLICLLGLNVFQIQYSVTVKTYPLAGFFLTLGLLLWLSFQQTQSRRSLMLCALALAAAAATRFSLGLFFMPLGLSLLFRRKEQGDLPWLLFGLTGFTGLALFFGPFLLQAPEALKFALLDFHAARQVENALLLKAGFLSRTVQSYLLAVLALLCLLPSWKSWQPGSRSLALGILSVTLLHLLAPFPYDDYQAALYPVLALLISIEAAQRLSAELQPRLAPLALLTCLLFAFSSAQLSSWFSNGQDRIWWQTKNQSDLSLLRQTASTLNALPAESIFTTDLYLAIEANLEVPRGLEMGPFCYFPEMDSEQAAALQVMNTQRLQALIRENNADLAALSGYSFAIACPEIVPVQSSIRKEFLTKIQNQYQLLQKIEDFGQGQTELKLFISSER